MKTRSIYIAITALLLAMSTGTAWSQVTSARVEGTITDKGKPVPNVDVVLTNPQTGKSYKMKTDKNGQFISIGVAFGDYLEDVVSASGESLFKKQVHLSGAGGDADNLSIDISSGGSLKPKLTKEEAERIEKIKAENAKAMNINALIAQYQAASKAQNWAEAKTVLNQMVVADPGRWDILQALADVQSKLGEYQDSIDSYEKGIKLAQDVIAGNGPKSSGGAAPDLAKAKLGIAQMLAAEGNSYIKLNKQPEAIAALTKAAEMDPNPATAFFNLCAIQYNAGNVQAAAPACDKAIAADPNKADAYFIKGSVLIGMSDGKLDSGGHLIVPPGTKEALNKYLELAPEGGHANDVKAMLEAIGAKIETSFKDKGGKKK